MSRLRWIALGAALGGVAACGYPTFSYGTGTGGAGGSGGGATTSTTTTTSSSSSTTTTSSSSSTGGPVMCRLRHDAEDCKANERCTIADESTGHTHCVAVAASPLAPYDACTDDDSCPAGTWCDWRTATCTPFCESANDCTGGGDCVSAKNSMSKSVPGASVCTANCDPVDLFSCGTGAACNYDNNLASFDCFYSQNKPEGSSCAFGDCAPTLVCGSSCLYWCHPVNQVSSDCFGGMCKAFGNLTPTYNGATYGYCQ